ncbi:MAG: hypothetical protein K2K34_08055, partial [Oscillospiraceae bacterium]|nr:hypothetical protein [Oscillospiraceae bacterium]
MASNSAAVVSEKAKKLTKKDRNYSAPKTMTEKIADVLYMIMRCAVVVNVFALFFPTFNAVRISQNINGNMSLFTCAISYKSMLSTFKAVLRRQDWLEPAFKGLSFCAALIIVAAVIAIVGGCMSLGNRNMKKIGCFFTLAAGAVELVG